MLYIYAYVHTCLHVTHSIKNNDKLLLTILLPHHIKVVKAILVERHYQELE